MFVCVYVVVYMYIYVYLYYDCIVICVCVYDYVYRESQEKCARIRDSVPYAKLYRYNPKHPYLKWNG